MDAAHLLLPVASREVALNLRHLQALTREGIRHVVELCRLPAGAIDDRPRLTPAVLADVDDALSGLGLRRGMSEGLLDRMLEPALEARDGSPPDVVVSPTEAG